MLFNSWGYFLFLLVFVTAYWVLPRPRLRVALLAAASVLFYAMWRWEFALLVIFSAAVDFVVAQNISRHDDDRTRRRWLMVSLVINLGLLVFFKYTYFIVDNVRLVGSFAGADIPALADVGVRIILPLGISFYTFQTVSYSIDVYRRVAEPQKDFTLFLAYVMFWPQLIAGPVLRAGEVIPELIAPRGRPSREDLVVGGTRILYGLAKKVVLADSIALSVDAAFTRDATTLTAFDVWVATFLFGFQIYFDFSGYSEMAIGSARLLGIRFPENFNWPYISKSPREFWGRWHISLSSWIRDYLYLPLTGQRFKTRSEGGLEGAVTDDNRRRNRALLLTWFIMGLWHGAAWTFAVWGLFHAGWILLYRLVSPLKSLPKRHPYLAWALTLPVAMAGWIPFRANGLADTGTMFLSLIDPRAYRIVGHALPMYDYMWALVLTVGFVVAYAVVQRRALDRLPSSLAAVLRTGWVAVLVCSIILCMGRVQQFIYFQF